MLDAARNRVRRHRRLLAAAPGLVVCALAQSAPVSEAATFRVMLAGDSIVEGCEFRRPGHTDGLAAAVRRALQARGLRPGGRGYIPAHDARASTPESPRSYWPLEYTGTWIFEGTFGSAPSTFGADGFSSRSASSDSAVSAIIRADRVGVLYGIAPDAGSFSVAIGDRAQRVNARGRSPATGVKWLAAPDPLDRLRISAIAGGVARIAGLIARQHHGDVELSEVGRSGAQALDDLSAPNRQALAALQPGLTVLMFGTNEEGLALGGDVADAERRLTQGLVRRARLARRSGPCVVVPHAPNTRPGWLQRRLWRAAAGGARGGGCDFRPVLSGVWRDGDDSLQKGLTADGVHPTAAGYELMGRKIAALIVSYLGDARRHGDVSR